MGGNDLIQLSMPDIFNCFASEQKSKNNKDKDNLL